MPVSTAWDLKFAVSDALGETSDPGAHKLATIDEARSSFNSPAFHSCANRRSQMNPLRRDTKQPRGCTRKMITIIKARLRLRKRLTHRDVFDARGSCGGMGAL